MLPTVTPAGRKPSTACVPAAEPSVRNSFVLAPSYAMKWACPLNSKKSSALMLDPAEPGVTSASICAGVSTIRRRGSSASIAARPTAAVADLFHEPIMTSSSDCRGIGVKGLRAAAGAGGSAADHPYRFDRRPLVDLVHLAAVQSRA